MTSSECIGFWLECSTGILRNIAEYCRILQKVYGVLRRCLPHQTRYAISNDIENDTIQRSFVPYHSTPFHSTPFNAIHHSSSLTGDSSDVWSPETAPDRVDEWARAINFGHHHHKLATQCLTISAPEKISFITLDSPKFGGKVWTLQSLKRLFTLDRCSQIMFRSLSHRRWVPIWMDPPDSSSVIYPRCCVLASLSPMLYPRCSVPPAHLHTKPHNL